VRCTGHEELALRVDEVAHELVASVRRVCPDDGGTGQSGRLEPEDELRRVVREHRHVEWAVAAVLGQPCGASGRLGHHLAVAPAPLRRQKARALVVGSRQHQLRDAARSGHGVSPLVANENTLQNTPVPGPAWAKLEASESSQLAHRKGTASEKLPPP